MNKQEFLSEINKIIDGHCALLSDIACKPMVIIIDYQKEHDNLRSLVDASRCHLKNKVVMYEILRKTSPNHLSDRCYRKDANALYNALYRFKMNLPCCLSK